MPWMEDDQLHADPRVVKAWITGWALARETAPPVPDGGGFRVDVGWPRQRVRYVFPSVDEGMRRIAERVTEPWILLKACAPPDAVRTCLPPRWMIERLGFMMTRDGPAPPPHAARVDGYTLELDATGPVSIATVLDARGDVAAGGRLAQVGEFAIYDRIETHADHRRRGLGRAVMAALEAVARSRGAVRGVLVATAEGRALYEALGWRLHSLYTTAAIPATSPE
jgi:GNAT superfamily N-acetyltransferase